MTAYVLDLTDADRTRVAEVGGKAANLGELSRIRGISVPPGFCVTVAACGRISADAPIPADVADAIAAAYARLGPDAPCAVRSSATAEDLASASSAGQHESYLDLVGIDAILDGVRRCVASLGSDRAVAYHARSGVGAGSNRMAVLVQRMVPAEAAGVLFTADPVGGNRRTTCIEAVRGLGDALVSGRATPETWRVRWGTIVERPTAPVLSDVLALALEGLGRRIEADLGGPQDIEWCLAHGGIHVVQSRPITTLFPIPAAAADGQPHVYLSVGHGQMMTDPAPPLAISLRQLTGAAQFHEAGGRLWVDATRMLASPAARAGLLRTMDRNDPLMADALRTVVDQGLVPTVPDAAPTGAPPSPPPPLEAEPGRVERLIARSDASVAGLERGVAGLAGAALFDRVVADFEVLKADLREPESVRTFMSAIEATYQLDEHLAEWLGEKRIVDALTLSVPGNVTSEMGLALLDVADVLREHGEDGPAFRAALQGWLDRYGMRCVGEIDVTRPRWAERPDLLLPVLRGYARDLPPGEAKRRFEEGRLRAEAAARDVLDRVRALPDGEAKADDTRRAIERVRTYMGYREHPKYAMIRRYFVYKQAFLRLADELVTAGVLDDREDVFWLTVPELGEAVRTSTVDASVLQERRAAFEGYRRLRVPRVLTSDGDMLDGSWRRDGIPDGALPGIAVSAGTVEGRARVVLDPADAALEPGDILVTPFTDPSWTPVFVGIAGLVTEVGGVMTHGAVIAREYGLPAVVAVADATRRIRDGQRIRVNGSEGYVELLD